MTSFNAFRLRGLRFATLASLAVMALPAMALPGVAAPDAAGREGAASDGAALYRGNCAMCHGPGGAGRPGSYPALAGRVGKIAETAEGRAYLSSVLIAGLHGPIVAGGQPYKGYMPPFRMLSDQDIAALLSYVATLDPDAPKAGTGTAHPAVSDADVAKARAAAPTAASVLGQRQALEAEKKIP